VVSEGGNIADFETISTAQEIMKSSRPDIDKVSALLDLFYQKYPTTAPRTDLNHPAFFATRRPFRNWILAQNGNNPFDYWSMVYRATQEWFPGPGYPPTLHAFCASMETHSCTYAWHEREGFDKLLKDMLAWKASKNPQRR